MTFSIVAWDPDSPSGPEWGVGVASKFLAVGSVVPFARAGAGAIATQAFANLAYGIEGIEMLARGKGAVEVVTELVDADDDRAQRQLGVVAADGSSAAYTGGECFAWAGDRQGAGYTCQGNILSGSEVVDDMAAAFEDADGTLVRRLVSALDAGDRAGGDRRGRQSAAVLVVREGAGYGGATDVAVDLRVDDHRDPVAALRRLLDAHELLYPRPEELEFVDVDETLAAELRDLLRATGREVSDSGGYDDALKETLFAFVGTENLEERWTDRAAVEVRVLAYLRDFARPRG